MDAFELLKADHKKVAQLFDRLEAASGKAKIKIFEEIKTELELHTHLEETIFYPALEKPEETHDLTLEAYEEHKVVKELLSELDGARSADDEWQAKATVLRENVEHHVEEEENELFDSAKDALSDEQIESLGARMETEKARKQGRPAPRRSVAKGAKSSAKSSKAGGAKPGIISRIAGFVGLGGDTAKKSARKTSSKRRTAASKGAKPSAKTASRNKGGKSSDATASKRSSGARASKRASGSRSTSSAKTGSRKASGRKATTRK